MSSEKPTAIRTHPELTEEQEAALHTFRRELLEEGAITDEGDSLGTQYDWVLLRFLRARKYNLKNAKIMIKNCIEWRKTAQGVGVDQLYRNLDPYDYPERQEVFKYWPIWYHKTDKKGRPINVQSLGGTDVAALYKVMSPEKFWETILVTAEGAMREILPGSSYAAKRVVDSILVIVDLKDFGLGKFWQMKNLIRDSFQITQDYLPETMGMLVIINAPSTFTAIWTAVKPWLAKETQEKVCIFGSDYAPFLLEEIDAENLPESLGGKCTCSETGGCQFSNVGPWMEGRKERREKWLRGERSRPGLGLEDVEEEEKEREAREKGEKEEERAEEEKEEGAKRLSSSPVSPHSAVPMSASEI
ncbi:CRAL/TRIO domain-containing protein [Fomitiporia mediterranea MF3/22]|uniref:CRAL/TRIO domain-containing protein n=1 Tax=Fomitiporia mediterranea (strain MF3/22) TaxID=694068 RepID=UPI000440787F|nr:CRAL/TRIO domain-containing protein [Fomitiporia mediterranea MF3/22]EJC98105.1 CRAL/TRIO domain-containing protein [Fomitiporia mediterranea MF3/22]